MLTIIRTTSIALCLIDSVIVFDDKTAIKFWFSDDQTEIPLDTLTEIITSKDNTPDPNKDGKNKEFDIGAVKSASTPEVTPILIISLSLFGMREQQRQIYHSKGST